MRPSEQTYQKAEVLKRLNEVIQGIDNDKVKPELLTLFTQLCMIESSYIAECNKYFELLKSDLDTLRLMVVAMEFDLNATRAERDKLKAKLDG